MNNDIVPDSPIIVMVNKVKGMKPEERLQDQQRCFASIGSAVVRLAAHVRVIEEEGGDLTEMRDRFGTRFVDQLRLVACGMLLPELMHRFFAAVSLLAEVRGLPIPDQRRLAAGEPVRLLVLGPDGRQEMRLKDPLKMSQDEIRQVFARDHIRDDAEQVGWLDRERLRLARPVPVAVGRIRIDKERGVAVFPRRGDYTLAELVEVVKVLQK